ncbi:hypothetical protein C8Q69DRAFT_482032 [Paecilomyces variotii]|uniref:Uncharacterized protein n=1 Tax=Byssochlamys spectabilis TaxID=264951 RepID=A0A443HIS6_BYSSP|nr:hypothetical protein C8Q69DRAFT_482032 [Paecilomyces variotii]KAJ9363747.1 hypothetical protein DTO280E4_2337 [Paecilomyces variotii]KAJ9386441.1 hypothetical protein DTO063F5_3704 [Paecilomyces variotii]RWQ91666.1 hypothetical protein C8Q69DRAFT_482032 [Paecilomyces variotii]
MTVGTPPVAELNNSAQTWFYQIKSDIRAASESVELRYENISEDKGALLVDSLSEDSDVERYRPRFSYNSFVKALNVLVMPTEVHDVHQHWISSEKLDMVLGGFLTAAEGHALTLGVGTTINHLNGPYTGSRKDPDMLIRHELEPLPSIAIESGWAESLPRLHADMRLWLVGGEPDVQLVIILRWSKISGTPIQRVKGKYEIWERDTANTPYCKDSGAIFPPPPANLGPQVIPITRAQLFGPAHIFPGQNGTDIWNLRVDLLRTWASKAINRMGYIPA